jgi:hypothetical protein
MPGSARLRQERCSRAAGWPGLRPPAGPPHQCLRVSARTGDLRAAGKPVGCRREFAPFRLHSAGRVPGYPFGANRKVTGPTYRRQTASSLTLGVVSS